MPDDPPRWPSMLPILFLLLSAVDAWASPSTTDLCLDLPRGHATTDWIAAAEMAGMRLQDSGCDATARLEAVHGRWRLTVHTGDGTVLQPQDQFPVPRTQVEREELVSLIFSLLHPMSGLARDRTGEGGGADAGATVEALDPVAPETVPAAVATAPTLDLRIALPARLQTPTPTAPAEPTPPVPDPILPAIEPPTIVAPAPSPPIVTVAAPPEPAIGLPAPPTPAEPVVHPPLPAPVPDAVGPPRTFHMPSLFAEIGFGLTSRDGVTDSLGYRATLGWVSEGRHLRCGIGADLPAAYDVDVLGPTREMDTKDLRIGAWWRPGGEVGAVAGGLAGLSWRTFTENGESVDARAIPMLALEVGLSISIGSRWSVVLEPRIHLERDLVDTEMIVNGVSLGLLVPWSLGLSVDMLGITP